MTIVLNGTSGITTPGLTNDGSQTITNGTANGVAYLNGSKVLTTGSALTFDGTNLGIGTSSPTWRLSVKQSGNTSNASLGLMSINSANDTFIGLGYDANSDTTRIYSSYVSDGAHKAITLWTADAERMRITASGNVGIGTSSPAGKLDILTGTNRGYFDDSAGSLFRLNAVNAANSAYAPLSLNGSVLTFQTSATERARIDSSGNLLVGTTSTSPRDFTSGSGTRIPQPGAPFEVATTDSNCVFINYTGTANGSANLIFFRQQGSLRGTISTNGSSVSYNTSSDYRLKENIQPMTGALAKVAALKPCTYNWKADGSEGEGFIAHELAEVVPQCVTGEKDAVDAEGNPVYQGIDTSFLIATLTAALQELNAKVEAQAAEIAALKGQA